MKSNITSYESKKKLTTLVENKTTYNASVAELNIFETQKIANKVSLTFGFPVIASMIKGKKVMHIEGMQSFDFFPGQSVVMPSNKEMVIDFPVATESNPTQCLALGIHKDKISDVVSNFNYETEIEGENQNWNLDETASHLINNDPVNQLLDRLVFTFIDHNKSKDLLLDLMIQELIVRLLQTKAKSIFLTDHILNDTRIGHVIQYIKENLTNKDINVDELAEKAYMSPSNFHKKFKNTLGISPIDFINSEKIKFAKKLIKTRSKLSINEIALLSGFNNSSYFHRQFKKLELITPQQFKSSINGLI